MLLQRDEMSQLIRWARGKDPGLDINWFIRAVSLVERIDPEDVLLPLDWDHLRMTFCVIAIHLDRQIQDDHQDLRS